MLRVTLLSLLALGAPALAQAAVEEEVVFEEEVDTSALSAKVVPEYDYQPWLVVLPLAVVGLVAVNTAFRTKRKRARRTQDSQIRG